MANLNFSILYAGFKDGLFDRQSAPPYAHRSIHTAITILKAIGADGADLEQIQRPPKRETRAA